MSDSPDPDLIASVQKAISTYSDLLPPLSTKYFMRPPIKFLVSIVAALHNRTGFGSGIFTPEQLSGDLPEPQDKLAFFAALRQYVAYVSGQTVDVSTRAIVRGREVSKTLVFMRQIVEAAEHPTHRFDSVRVRTAPKETPIASNSEENDKLQAEIKRLLTVVKTQKVEIEKLKEVDQNGIWVCHENSFSFDVKLPKPILQDRKRALVRFVPTGKQSED